MTVQNFYTVVASPNTGAQTTPAGKPVTALGSNAASATNFFDFFLAQLKGTTPTTQENILPQTNNKESSLQSKNPLLAKDTKLDLTQILTSSQATQEQVEQTQNMLGADIATLEALSLATQTQDAALLPDGVTIATATTPQPLAPGLEIDFEIAQGPLTIPKPDIKLQKLDIVLDDNALKNAPNKVALEGFLADLNAYLAQSGIDLTTSNLTPDQITALKTKINELWQKFELSNDQQNVSADDKIAKPLADLFASLIALVDPKTQSVFSAPVASDVAFNQKAAEGTLSKQEMDIAARLNNLVVGGEEGEIIDPATGEEDFTALLQKVSNKLKNVGNDLNAIKPTTQKSNIESLPASGLITTPTVSSFYGLSDDTSHTSIDGPVYQVTDARNLTNMITQVQNAGRAHPATQMVAATIQKSISNGESKNITLQLDPPDLGKVEIRLQFGKDKTLKATVISEKPETYMMLQRDAETLHKVLENSGLNSESGLSFELAHEGYDFNHNGRHDGDSQAKNNANDNDSNLIETTMNWRIDPQTGHMRYNIFA